MNWFRFKERTIIALICIVFQHKLVTRYYYLTSGEALPRINFVGLRLIIMVFCDCCCVVGCNTTKEQNRDLSFHKFPHPISAKSKKQIVEAIGRQNDASFNSLKATICSRHFSPDCFILVAGPYPGRRLKKDCFPTLNLPSASSDAGCCSKIDETPVISEAEPSTAASPEVSVDSTDSRSTDSSDTLSKFTDEEILSELSQRQKLFVCACGMVFEDRALYYLHRSCHNPVQPNKCAVCGFESNDWLAFHAHFFQHSNDSQMAEVVEID